MPIVYFDFGCGCHGDADTRPKKMSFCFKNNPPVILSHWHADHYMAAYLLDKRALDCTWIAPDQEGIPASAKFAARLKLIKHILIWPSTLPSLKTQWGELVKCTGDKLNTSGLAWDAVIGAPVPSQGPRYRVLMPGDAGYEHINTAQCAQYDALIVPHHGGSADGQIPKPCALKTGLPCVLSYGMYGNRMNTYGHPTQETLSKLDAACWKHRMNTPDGTVSIGFDPNSLCSSVPSYPDMCDLSIQQSWP